MSAPLIEWLEGRRQSALQIANTLQGDHRQRWLETASNFSQCAQAVKLIAAASGDDDDNVPLRIFIALKILRAWTGGTAGFDGEVVVCVYTWFDGGMKGPIPWPQSPFFAQWAEENGFSKVGDSDWIPLRC